MGEPLSSGACGLRTGNRGQGSEERAARKSMMTKRISKSLIVNGDTLVSEAEWNSELEAKHHKLLEWIRAQGLEGGLIWRKENGAWVTGGAVEVRVLTPAETGVASLLITAAGKRYYFTTENEAPRLKDEEFGALDFEPVQFPWYADDT